MDVIRIIEHRDDFQRSGPPVSEDRRPHPPKRRYQARRCRYSDPEQAAIWKTTQILLNKVIYADGYLNQLFVSFACRLQAAGVRRPCMTK